MTEPFDAAYLDEKINKAEGTWEGVDTQAFMDEVRGREDSERELPEGWVETTLATVADITMGQSPDSSTYNEVGEGMPFFQGKAEFGMVSPVVRKWCTEPTKVASQGSILMSVRAPVGPINIADKTCCIGRGLCAISSNASTSQDFLAHFLKERGPWLSEQGTGTTFKAISGDFIRSLTIPIPPLPEQKSIVAKLDTLLGRLGECQARLDRVPALLKRFRQSVLAAATSGRLTEDWREENDLPDPRTLLLDFYKRSELDFSHRSNERRSKGAKKPRKPNFLNYDFDDNYRQHSEVASWAVVPVGMLADCVVPGRDKPKSFSGSVPWVTLPDIKANRIQFDSIGLKLSESEISEVGGRKIPEHSVIMSVIGRFGIACVTDAEIVINQQLHAFLPNELYVPEYLAFSIVCLEEHMTEISTSTTIAYLNKENANSLPINYPPFSEQLEIVRRVESLFALADRIEARYQAAKAKVDRLQPALLAKAFRGELVAQDPNDEPASVVLERVKAQSGTERPPSRRGRQRK